MGVIIHGKGFIIVNRVSSIEGTWHASTFSILSISTHFTLNGNGFGMECVAAAAAI